MDQIAIVILNYNGQAFLKQFLPALIKYSEGAAIYVADNASTDNSLKTLAEFTEVKIIKLDKNYGYAGGYNEALRKIEANYYLLVNSDVEVTDSWIAPLRQFLETNPQYATVQPKILDYNNRNQFEYAGASGGFLDILAYPYCRGRVFNTLEEDKGQYNDTLDIFWTTGACFMIRAEVFHELGGFDAHFFAHMEEIDMCWRLKSHDLKAAAVPDSVVYHVGGGTLNKVSSRKTYLNIRNGLYLLFKNMPKTQLIFVLLLRIPLDWMAGLMLWREHSFSHFMAVLRAHAHAFGRMSFYLRSNNIRSSSSISNQKSFLLVWEYFVRKKTSFRALNNTK